MPIDRCEVVLHHHRVPPSRVRLLGLPLLFKAVTTSAEAKQRIRASVFDVWEVGSLVCRLNVGVQEGTSRRYSHLWSIKITLCIFVLFGLDTVIAHAR